MLRTSLLAFILPLLSLSVSFADRPVFFKDVDLFDGKELIRTTNVLVVDGKIAGVGPDTQQPENAAVVQGRGKTLVPGLIDCHTHAFSESHLAQAALFGVTTELDMMCEPSLAAALRRPRATSPTASRRADFYSAGAAVTVAGGHGTQFGFPVPTLDDADSARSFVKARVAEGSDYIKIIIEDGSAFGFSRPTLNREMVFEAARAAKDFDKLAVAHVSTQATAQLATDAGVNGLVHLFCEARISDELAQKMKEQGMFVVPTACVISNAAGSNTSGLVSGNAALQPLLTRGNLANLKASFPAHGGNNSWDNLKRNIEVLRRHGVPVLAGTDAPNPGTVHGASMHHELALLVSAGMTPRDALAAATSAPAFQFNLKDRGRIAEGCLADLLLVEGDPTEDIQKLTNIVGVWKNGRPVDRSSRIKRVQSEQNTTIAAAGTGPRTISRFEDGTTTAGFGAGWNGSTDTMMGGTSTVALKVVDDGADGTRKSMHVSGKIQSGTPAFSGVMFSPGDVQMQPADLSRYHALSFWAKGGQEKVSVMLFTRKRGYNPSVKSITVNEQWKKYVLPINEFDQSDGKDVLGIWFGCEQPGNYSFQLDELALDRR